MSRIRLLAAISLIVALAVAVVVLLVGQRSSDTTDRLAASAPSEVAPPASSPQPVEIPTPDNTGRDFDHIWREIQRFNDWTYEHPEVALDYIHLIYHPDCLCYAALRENLLLALHNGVHYEDLTTRVESVVVISDLGQTVRIETRLSIAPRRVVNEQGAIVQSDQGVPPRDFVAELELQSDGRWLARSITIKKPVMSIPGDPVGDAASPEGDIPVTQPARAP